jgi:phosphatidylglycerophosphate synthase
MIDAALLPLQRRALHPAAEALVRRGISADRITVIGCIIGVVAAVCAALGLFWLALAGLVLNRVADGLDGAVARMTAPTDRGAFLDIALDFVFYTAFPLGFVLADPAANAVPGAILIASFVLTGTSFLAFAVMAERKGMSAADYPSKGIYYLGGLTEGAETIGFFILICVFPGAFPVLASLFAAACLVTAVTRIMAGWRAFG